MDLAEIARAVGGTVAAEHAEVLVTAPASLDSRAVPRGGLFVALAGERADGHDYVAGAMASGAVAVLASRPLEEPHVLVSDVTVALGRLARHLLGRLAENGEAPTVLAMTGSQGKTGTKDYLAQVLGVVQPTVATAGNNNNELGVPLTVLRADASTRHLVVEMGARGIGHVAELCEIAPPDVAAVLNIGSAHVGEFGSRENIAVAKGEIIEALTGAGTAVLNADDDLTRAMRPRTRAHVLTFGLAQDADVRAVDVSMDVMGRPAFTLTHAGRRAQVVLTHIGAHQVSNALAAAAMALAVGLDLDLVAHALGTTGNFSRWRMEPHVRGDGLLVVNDAYNANPESMRAALEALEHIGSSRRGRAIAVLGEMRELGDDALAGHRGVGRDAALHHVDVLVTIGDAAAAMSEGALSVPAWGGEVIVTASREEASRWLRENVVASDAVLVKASRGAALEHVVEQLLVEGPAVR